MGTCYGLCIRLFSLLATAVALLLFQFGLDDRHKGSYSKVDVAVTYVLSVWAAVLSSWITYGLVPPFLEDF